MNKLFLLAILVAIHVHLWGQSVNGRILDPYELPIVGANIFNLSNNEHVHSSVDGSFQLPNVVVGDTLQVSHVAYQTAVWVVETLDEPLKIRLESLFFALDEVVITNKVNALELVADIDIQVNPVNSSQDVLEKVPGLFIGQHAGGGKAEQIFLRGLDIDHGTDINITVDGLPVNMVSHAHGQGYADLHFVIPETIEQIDFGKGPYYQDQGNFATAGFVGFKTKKGLDQSLVKMEMGQFNTQRLLGMFKLLNNENQSAYVASEYISSDGPFDSSQNFNRINLFGKYAAFLNQQDRIGVTVSHFDSRWDASGQIPIRAVQGGLIGRFGAIDDTEGGQTGRTNFLVNYDRIIDEHTSISNSIYFSIYDFELFSNFTFFLEDPVNGDQIKQHERRNMYGAKSQYSKSFTFDKSEGVLLAEVSLRNDVSSDNELSRTLNRKETLEQIQLGNVNETNIGLSLGTEWYWKKWTFNPSVRLDYFKFNYNDALQTAYQTQSATKSIVSPKLNILYQQSSTLQLYLKGGRGFHSNDTRGVVVREGLDILPAAYGFDVGCVWKPSPKMLVNMAYWYLYLEQEFVYVGDAGIVEPSGQTARQGFDFSYRYQPLPFLFWNLDVNYTHARAIDEENGQDHIPLAPSLTWVTGLHLNHPDGYYGSATIRHLRDRPANEDNSIVAAGYTVVDLNMGYQWKRLDVSIQIQNLLDTEWNETQFATESRLFAELEPVEEIHFTPGVPFFIKGVLGYRF